MSSNKDEEDKKNGKPNPTEDMIKNILLNLYKFNITELKKLDSYDDANFYFEVITNDNSLSYLIKFYNFVESKSLDILLGYSLLLNKIVDEGIKYKEINNSINFPIVPQAIKSINNVDVEFVNDCLMLNNSKQMLAVRVYNWVDGDTLNKVGGSDNLCVGCGNALGLINKALIGFDHQSFHRQHAWDLKQFQESIQFVKYISEKDISDVIYSIEKYFIDVILPDSNKFESSVIMGDCNDANVIIENIEDNPSVVGIIDFGDSVYTWRINDLAIALAYSLLSNHGLENPRNSVACIVGGYCLHIKLNETEIKHLKTLIMIRLSISISIGAFSILKDPDNEYLKLHALPAKKAIIELYEWDSEEFIIFINKIINITKTSSSSTSLTDLSKILTKEL